MYPPLSSPFDNLLPRPYVYHHRLWPDNYIHRLYPLVTATMRNAHLSAYALLSSYPRKIKNNIPCVVQLCAMDTKMQSTRYRPALCRHVSSTSTRAGFSSAAATRSLSLSCLLTTDMRVAFSYCHQRLDITKPHRPACSLW